MSLGPDLDRYLEGLAVATPRTPTELRDEAMRRLHALPETAPMADRVQLAVVVCCGGDPDKDATFGQIAEVAGCTIADVHQALRHQREVADL